MFIGSTTAKASLQCELSKQKMFAPKKLFATDHDPKLKPKYIGPKITFCRGHIVICVYSAKAFVLAWKKQARPKEFVQLFATGIL